MEDVSEDSEEASVGDVGDVDVSERFVGEAGGVLLVVGNSSSDGGNTSDSCLSPVIYERKKTD